jgi:hypothetical protein
VTPSLPPLRYVVRYGSPCGPLLYDTSFTGTVNDGCAASAPCCPTGLAAGCAGTAGAYCPPNGGGGGPPGGPGAGITPNLVIPAGATSIYVTAYGVCGGTGNTIKVTGADGGRCP